MPLTVPYFTDTFARANHAPVAGTNSTGGVGNGWIDRAGNFWGINSNSLLINNIVAMQTDYLYRPLTEESINQRMVVTITSSSTAVINTALVLRLNPVTNSGYFCFIDGAGSLHFMTSVNGGAFVLVAGTGANTLTANTSYILDFSAVQTNTSSTTLTTIVYLASAPTVPLFQLTYVDSTVALQTYGTFGISCPTVAANLVTGTSNVTLYNQVALNLTPTVASVNSASSVVSITPLLLASSATLAATVTGGGTLSTAAPTSGVAFTYTSPATGSGTATVTVTDATDGISATCAIAYAPSTVTLSPTYTNATGTPSVVVSITPTHGGTAGTLSASVSGGGTLSTLAPISGTAFAYTAPASGSGTAIVTVLDSNGVTATSTIQYNATTVIANVHYNLTAWTTGAVVAAGTRVSSNGYAWQALTSGTTGTTAPLIANATAASSGIIHLSDGGVTWKLLSHIDYTTLQAWWNALPTPLTAAATANVWNNGAIGISAAPELTCSGGKTSSLYPATICPAPGEGFVDVAAASGCSWSKPLNENLGGASFHLASGSALMNIANSEVIHLTGLVLYINGYASAATYFCKATDNTASVLTINGCIMVGADYAVSTFITTTYSAPSLVLINAVLRNGYTTNPMISTAAASILMENCTFETAGTQQPYLVSSSNAVTLRNTIFAINTVPITFTGTTPISSSHNAFAATLGSLSITDSGSIFTAQNYTSTIMGTVNGGEDDARMVPGCTTYRTGTTPTYATSDIYGTVRTGGYDMGAMQAVAYTAAVANIHPNLAAWQPMTTVTSGMRVFSNGQAWQAMTSSVTGFTAPAGSANVSDGVVTWKWLSSYDFSDSSTWYYFLPVTLTQPVTARFWNNGIINGGIYIGGPVGGKANGTNVITITCAPGESFIDYHITNPSAPLTISPSTGVYFTGSISINLGDTITISKMQFAPTSGAVVAFNGNGIGINLTNCILSAANYFDNNAYNGGANFTNCLGFITGSAAISGAAFENTQNITNCTFIAVNAPAGLAVYSGALWTSKLVENCIFIGFGSFANSAQITSVHNIFSTATVGTVASDTGSIFNAVASTLFVNPASDFRLLPGCPAFDTGITASGVTTDIFGTSRPQYAAYDIGCYELPFVAAPQWPIIVWLE